MTDSTALHRHMCELMPWVANGRASAQERQALEQHVTGCADCAQEWAFQQQLLGALSTSDAPARDAEPGLRRLLARVEADDAPRAPAFVRARGWLAAVAAAEALALVIAGAAWWQDARRPAYRTLSAPQAPAPGATLRLVPAGDMSLEEFDALLRGAGLTIVAGPSEAGVYALAPQVPMDAAATQRALARLRAGAKVRFAEPVGAP